MAKNQLKAYPEDIFKTVTDNSETYRVPDYQRPFSWGKKEIDNIFDLIDDIKNNPDEEQDAFLGAIILKSQGSSFFEIVDGQQRISTFYIILSVFFYKYYEFYKEYKSEIDSKDRNLFSQKIQKNIENMFSSNRNNKNKPKIIPAMEDWQEFNDLVITEYLKELYELFELGEDDDFDDIALFPPTPQFYQQNKMLEIVSTIDDNLNAFLEDDFRKSNLDEDRIQENLLTFDDFIDILKKIEVVIVELAENQDPIEVFKSLNFEGIDLNDLDLLKAELMALYPPDAIIEKADFVKDFWHPFLEGFRKGMEFENPNSKYDAVQR